MRLFHGTRSRIHRFGAFSHFGTEKAAVQRALQVASWAAIERVAEEELGANVRAAKSRAFRAAQGREFSDHLFYPTPLSKSFVTEARHILSRPGRGMQPEDFRKVRLYQIDFNHKNALQVVDTGKSSLEEHTVNSIAQALEWSGAEQNAFFQKPGRLNEKLATRLAEEGYDALFYKNEVEDRGSLSYVNVAESQVEIEREISLSERDFHNVDVEKLFEAEKEEAIALSH